MVKRKSRTRTFEDIKHRDVLAELRRVSVALTDSQRQIAQYVIENPHEVAFSTLDQLGAELQMNPSTIVRFAYRLGLNGFPDLQERMREVLRGQLSRVPDPDGSIPIHMAETSFGASLSQDSQNLHRAIYDLTAGALIRAVEILAKAKNIYVVGASLTAPLAQYCALTLSDKRSGILLVPEEELGTYPITHISSEDCVLALTLLPDAAATHGFVARAKQTNVQIIVVTDSPSSNITHIQEDAILHAPTTGIGSLSSMVAPMAVVEALLDGLSAFKRHQPGSSGANGHSALDS